MCSYEFSERQILKSERFLPEGKNQDSEYLRLEGGEYGDNYKSWLKRDEKKTEQRDCSLRPVYFLRIISIL